MKATKQLAIGYTAEEIEKEAYKIYPIHYKIGYGDEGREDVNNDLRNNFINTCEWYQNNIAKEREKEISVNFQYWLISKTNEQISKDNSIEQMYDLFINQKEK